MEQIPSMGLFLYFVIAGQSEREKQILIFNNMLFITGWWRLMLVSVGQLSLSFSFKRGPLMGALVSCSWFYDTLEFHGVDHWNYFAASVIIPFSKQPFFGCVGRFYFPRQVQKNLFILNVHRQICVLFTLIDVWPHVWFGWTAAIYN